MRALGFLSSYRDEETDVPGLWLRFLYTAPAARQLGGMGRVVGALLELATEQGFHEVYSDIYRDNSRSLQLHLKLGFVEVPPEKLASFSPLIDRAGRRGREIVILRWRSADHAAR